MSCGPFDQNEETQQWKREVETWKGHIKKLQKAGKACIKQHQLNANDSFDEISVVGTFETVERYLWEILAKTISNYLTPEAAPYKQLQNHMQFKAKHSECESTIGKLKKDVQRYQDTIKKVVKDRDDLGARLKDCKQQLKTGQDKGGSNLDQSKIKIIDEVVQTKEEGYYSDVQYLKQRLAQYETQIFKLRQENQHLKDRESKTNLERLAHDNHLSAQLETNRKSIEQTFKSQNSNIQKLQVDNDKLQAELQVFQNKEEQYLKTIEQLQVSHEYYVKQHERNLEEHLNQKTILQNHREALATQEKIIYGLKQQLSATQQEMLELQLKIQDQVQSHDVQIERRTLSHQKSTTSELPVYLDRKNSEFRSQIQELEQKLDQQQRFWKDNHVKATQLHQQEKEKYETEIQLCRRYAITLQQKLDENQHQDTTTSPNDLGGLSLDASRSVKIKLDEVQDPYISKSLAKIAEIREDVEKLRTEVEGFAGSKEDKVFLHLNELLIRKVVKLDDVETEGHFIIRQKRKEAIELTQNLLDTLKNKTQ